MRRILEHPQPGWNQAADQITLTPFRLPPPSLTSPRTERKLELYIIVDILWEWWTSLYDGPTISEPAFGMFRFTGRESETTSQWELGVGDSETSVRLSRDRVEAEIDFPARDSLPRGVTRWCESAMGKVLEGSMPSEPRSRRPDSGRQPRGHTTFGHLRPRTQPRESSQPSRSPRRDRVASNRRLHCN